MRDNVQNESVNVRNKMILYKYAITTAEEYYKGNTRYASIQDALSRGNLIIFRIFRIDNTKFYI
jgi:hypothetical protein